MYYAIGVSVPSLHRESTDSLICVILMHLAKGANLYCRRLQQFACSCQWTCHMEWSKKWLYCNLHL